MCVTFVLRSHNNSVSPVFLVNQDTTTTAFYLCIASGCTILKCTGQSEYVELSQALYIITLVIFNLEFGILKLK